MEFCTREMRTSKSVGQIKIEFVSHKGGRENPRFDPATEFL
jgi:hypothetical protein